MMKLKHVLILVFVVGFLVVCSIHIIDAHGKFVFHKVRKGDFLHRIAQMYGDEVEQICQRNNLPSKKIFRGQVLIILPQPRMVLTSWYGRPFHGRRMANGKIFNMNDSTVVAHKHLPFGTKLVVWHPGNKKTIFVVVQDRGPYIKGRELDLSYGAAKRLGMKKEGIAHLVCLVVGPKVIR